ncbi:MAG: DUF932 domain-containing protein [Gammaproteobacteria bacterium]
MSQLASRFTSAHVVRANEPLTDHQLRVAVPSIFADEAHESRSDRYAYIPTITVLDALRKEGFQPFMACQARVRDDSREGFAKHMMRLRHASQIDGKGSINEIILLNSHDGSSSYQMLAGCYRFVCQNGMICGDTFQDVRVQHRGNVVDNVIEGAYEVLDNFERVSESREEMAAIELTPDEQMAFAKASLPLRFPETADKPEPEGVLRRRRPEDRRNDLWTTFNVVQENLVKGGISFQRTSSTGKNRTIARTRRINGIDGNVSLNKALWTLTEEMKAIKTNRAAA